MQNAELVALPLAQRLQAMEALWDSLCRDAAQSLDVPVWHQEELRQRLDALDSGAVAVTPWELAKDRIRHRAEQLVGPG
jgi:putative addiction module component (TIGR02574 family)